MLKKRRKEHLIDVYIADHQKRILHLSPVYLFLLVLYVFYLLNHTVNF